MVCQSLDSVFGNSFTLVDLFVYPITCFYFFYALILFFIFFVLTLFIFFKEKEDTGKGNILSSAGTSIIATIFIALIGTLIKSTTGLVMIQKDIFLYVIAIAVLIIGFWGYSSRS